MDEKDILKPPKRDKLMHIIITQGICVLLILLTVFIVKSFFKTTYEELKTWYSETFQVDIDINQVMSGGEEDEV